MIQINNGTWRIGAKKLPGAEAGQSGWRLREKNQ